ncbi:uncharacterized protein LOC130745088 [Lotus japonicus]|uniref:uncharacterized protein LOC130745088 n=1 Tax=Lotus japonicus TaxID=34305 RepID=UPI00259106B1|nr:uncharacterized protein LOC130745088 [Lotus japonicus]
MTRESTESDRVLPENESGSESARFPYADSRVYRVSELTRESDNIACPNLSLVHPYTVVKGEEGDIMMLITPIQLKGDNYEEWARAMRNALQAKKKLGFVDGTLTKPKDDSAYAEDWWVVNSMLVAWILITIKPSLRSTITYMQSARDLWEDIEQRFSMGNGPRIYQLSGCM